MRKKEDNELESTEGYTDINKRRNVEEKNKDNREDEDKKMKQETESENSETDSIKSCSTGFVIWTRFSTFTLPPWDNQVIISFYHSKKKMQAFIQVSTL